MWKLGLSPSQISQIYGDKPLIRGLNNLTSIDLQFEFSDLK